MAGGVGLEPTGWQFWRLLQYQLCDPPINQIGASNDIRNRPSSFTNLCANHYTINAIKWSECRDLNPDRSLPKRVRYQVTLHSDKL